MEVFVEGDGIREVGARVELDAGHHRAHPAGAGEEDRGKSRGNVVGDLSQVRLAPGPAWILDRPRIAEKAVVHAQRLDDQVVDWKPYGPTPVRIASVETRGRLRGLVVESRDGATQVDIEWMVGVISRQRSQAVVAEEFALVEHVLEDASQAVFVDNGEQAALALRVLDVERNGGGVARLELDEQSKPRREIGKSAQCLVT